MATHRRLVTLDLITSQNPDSRFPPLRLSVFDTVSATVVDHVKHFVVAIDVGITTPEPRLSVAQQGPLIFLLHMRGALTSKFFYRP